MLKTKHIRVRLTTLDYFKKKYLKARFETWAAFFHRVMQFDQNRK